MAQLARDDTKTSKGTQVWCHNITSLYS